jgi:hypothetical protein
MATARDVLVADSRFEHLRDVDKVINDLVVECWVDQRGDHVETFIERHSRDPMHLTCFMPVENLSVKSETEVFGTRLLPLDDERIPRDVPWFGLEKPLMSVAAVEVVGTHYGRMAERARHPAEHSLRVLRVALREHRSINDWQLRLALGPTYAFENGLGGWRAPDDTAYDLGLDESLISLAREQPVGLMPTQPSNDMEKVTDLAMRWIERSQMSGEPLVALLYLFFALEALLGDKSEGLKAHGLAFRQAMLSHISTGGFTNPGSTWFLYDQVRSAAVHGEPAPPVSWEQVRRFAWGVRGTLNEYLVLAREHGLRKRSRVLRHLDEHPDRTRLVDWLTDYGGPVWTDYLSGMKDRHGAAPGA